MAVVFSFLGLKTHYRSVSRSRSSLFSLIRIIYFPNPKIIFGDFSRLHLADIQSHEAWLHTSYPPSRCSAEVSWRPPQYLQFRSWPQAAPRCTLSSTQQSRVFVGHPWSVYPRRCWLVTLPFWVLCQEARNSQFDLCFQCCSSLARLFFSPKTCQE